VSVRIQASQVVGRPVSQVFQFYAVEHVRNHPRWDPDIELEMITEGPMASGARIRRINKRSGAPVEGTMEVVEFEPDRAIGMVIHDGPTEMRGRTSFDALGPAQTRVILTLEIPGLPGSTDTGFLTGRVQRSLHLMKQLIESES
jgi:hypothetical protein